jgi:GLPGLI family protein
MKKLLLSLFLIGHFICFSQKQSANLQVEYKVFCNTDIPLTYLANLWVANNVGIYQERLSTTERWEERPTNVEGVDIRKPKDIMEPYMKIDLKKKETLFFASILRNDFLVKDSYELKWNIIGEKKDIAGYKCIKATTNFRGREWIAWFTSEIPLSFGPWKLNGLPGLILEAYDSTERYTFKLVKIEKKASEIFNKDFKTLVATKNKEAMTYKDYLSEQEEAIENMNKEFAQKMNIKMTSEKMPRNGEELIYEWEQ